MRNKSDGKIVSFRFDADKKSLVMTGDDGKEVRIGASGDGKDRRGGGAIGGGHHALWRGRQQGSGVGPGLSRSSPEGNYSADTPQGSQSTFTFKTKDAPSKVMSYYQDQLKSTGFTMNQMVTGDQGGMVTAEDSDKKRSLVVTVGSSGDEPRPASWPRKRSRATRWSGSAVAANAADPECDFP